MSASKAFQKAIVAALKADASVGAVVGDRIYDNPPAEAVFPYISIGPSDFVPFDAQDMVAREETVQIDIWSRDHGKKAECKAIVDAAFAALHRTIPVIDDPYALTFIYVTPSRVQDDPDGVTAHGFLTVAGHIEDTT